MIASAEDDMDEHFPPSVLSGLLVTDLINQMEIADGLKELLISTSMAIIFTYEWINSIIGYKFG
jgi:hypothetical protein